MVERRKIGLIYSYNENWIAGTYYIENLINALGLLEDEFQPELYVVSSFINFNILKENTNYRYINFVEHEYRYALLERLLNKATRFFFSRNLLEKRLISQRFLRKYSRLEQLLHKTFLLLGIKHQYKLFQTEFLFPLSDPDDYDFELIDSKVFWIPDFQEEYLPHLFTKDMIEKRRRKYKNISKNSNSVVFSSYNAKNDYDIFYPNHVSKAHVMRFAVSNLDYKMQQDEYNDFLKRIDLTKPYFFIPNQFWAHKNHKVVIDAIVHLPEEIKNSYHFVFSGKINDPRVPKYFETLINYIEANSVLESCRFIGFVTKVQLYNLIANSVATIQPSLFEGWSTVVEDVKYLNTRIILSDLPVHREQHGDCKYFFDPSNFESLINKIIEVCNEKYEKLEINNYRPHQINFAKSFLQI